MLYILFGIGGLIIIFLIILLIRAANVITMYKLLFERLQVDINKALIEINEIDTIGAYENDDEVGIFIKKLKESYSILTKVLE